MKKYCLLSLLPLLLLASCKDSESPRQMTEKPDSGEQQTETGGQEGQGGEVVHNDDNTTTYTEVISFSNTEYARDFPEGTNFTSASTDKNEQLRTFIDDQLDYYDLATEFDIDFCSSRKYDSVTYFQVSTGKNAENEGHLTWSSDYKIYHIKVTALNYANPYTDYKTGQTVPNVEGNAVVSINSVERELKTPAGQMPSVQTLESFEFEEGITTFTLKATGGRVLIKEIEITWIG